MRYDQLMKTILHSDPDDQPFFNFEHDDPFGDRFVFPPGPHLRSEAHDKWMLISVKDLAMLQTDMAKMNSKIRSLNGEVRRLKEHALQAPTLELLEFESPPREEATTRVRDIVKNNPGIRTSQIIEKLKIEPSIVAEILDGLATSGELEGQDVKNPD